MAAAPSVQNQQEVRIRLEWTGDKPEVWSGVLETSQGAFANPVSLNADADQAGTLWPNGQSLWLGRHSSRRHDGFDVTLRAPRSARICFMLQTDAQSRRRRQFEWSLAEVGRDPMVFESGDGTAHLSVVRVPGDELRVSIDRPHLIYRPCEKFRAVLLPNSNTAVSAVTAAKLEWEIGSVRTGRRVSNGTAPCPEARGQRVRSKVPVEITLPDDEGSFDLRFRLKENASDVLESVVQVLVLDDRPPRQAEQATAEGVIGRLRLDNSNASFPETIVLASAASPSGVGLNGPRLRDADNWDIIYTGGARQAADYLLR